MIPIPSANYAQILDGFSLSSIYGCRPLFAQNWYQSALGNLEKLRLDAGAFRPPFSNSYFEFRVSGRPVLASVGDEDEDGEAVIVLMFAA